MTLPLLIPIALIVVAVAVAAFTLLNGYYEKQSMRESLRSIDGYDLESQSVRTAREEELDENLVSRALLPAAAGLTQIARKLTPGGYADKIRGQFISSGTQNPDSVDRFLAMKAVLMPLGVLVAIANYIFEPITDGLMNIVLTGVIGYGLAMGPDLRLGRSVEARQKNIFRSLPDTLDLLTISVEAGLGFEQALDRVIKSVPGPLADEFARMLGETRAGAARADAMRAMEERCDIPEFRAFVLAIIQADAFGVSIGRVLRAQSDEMRIKRRQIAEEKAQKAPVKMLMPMVFCIFPSLFVVILGPAALNIMENFGS
jgi:tight adherence protein C